jgi:hypothetical protein
MMPEIQNFRIATDVAIMRQPFKKKKTCSQQQTLLQQWKYYWAQHFQVTTRQCIQAGSKQKLAATE